MNQAEPFDRALRRRRRDRAVSGFAAYSMLHDHIAEEILARLEGVKRDFTDVLDLGCAASQWRRRPGRRVLRVDSGFGFARLVGGVQCDEDRLPLADASFDLIVSAAALDAVNDLPGALLLAKRLLRPDGLFIAGFVGAGSLVKLRAICLAADLAAGDGAAARIHPLVDIRAGGDLLARAGFALPVADGESLTVRYRSLGGLLADLRGTAATNLLRVRDRRPLSRQWVAAAAEAFAAHADPDGRVSEHIEIVYLTGWSPSPEQPQPAARGSASQSLAAVLRAPKR